MTLASNVNKAVGYGNGVTTVWPFTFKFLDATDLVVIYTDTFGVDQVLLSSQYTLIANLDNAGGNIKYPTAGPGIANGTRLTILRLVDYLQSTDIVNQDGFYPDVVERALDKLAMGMQQLAERIGRAVVLPLSSVISNIFIPEPVEGSFLRWINGQLSNATIVALGALGLPVSVADGGTGATNAPTALTNLGGTVVGKAVFTAADQAAGRTALGLGTAAPLNVGIAANNVVQLDGTGKLPAVDGSQLTGLSAGDPLFQYLYFGS